MTDAHKLPDPYDVSADFSAALFEHLCSEMKLSYRGTRYRLPTHEEVRARGYTEDDDDILLFMRESDGEFFEIDIDVHARKVPVKEQPEQQEQQSEAP